LNTHKAAQHKSSKK